MCCNEFEVGIIVLAEGGSDPRTEAHLLGCEACRTHFGQLHRLIQAARIHETSAPADLVVRAQGLMRSRPRLVARLLGNGLANSGARRGDARDFALHVGVGDFSIRLHYAPTRDGWEVLGRAPTAGWSVAHEGGEVPCGSSGRFRLMASDLNGTMFVLRKDDTEIQVPSAQEMIELGS